MHKHLPLQKQFRLLLMLFLLAAGQLVPQKLHAQSSKHADILQLMDIMYGNSLVESIAIAMSEAMQIENSPMKREVLDSLRGLLQENVGALRDSIAGVYDRIFTAQEIKEMIKVYQTPIGKRIIETQNELLQQSMAVGRAWGQYHAEEIEKRLEPIVAKYKSLQLNEEYGSSANPIPDPLKPEVQNHPGNKRKIEGSKAYKYQMMYNEKLWKFIPAKDMSPLADLALAHKEEEIYVLLIAEESKLSLEQVRTAALVNLHKAAEQVKVRKSVLRKLNGQDVAVMVIDCRVDDLLLTYYNLYYAGSWGVLQLMVFGDQPTMKAQEEAVEALLSGLLPKP